MKNLREFDFQNKKVLVRCDFNVPQDKEGNILDDFKIKRTIPTIEYLIKNKAKIILISHLGRPEGKIIKELRLDSVAKRLSEFISSPVKKLDDCIGESVKEETKKMQAGEIILLENIQFNPGENRNTRDFAKTLAGYADIFVMEAFGQAHRNYASIAGINEFLPSAAGFLFEKEISVLKKIKDNPKKPLVVIIGGKKVKDKSGVINKLSGSADFILISGLIEKEIKDANIKFEFSHKIIGPLENIEAPDIDQETINIFKEKIKKAKTIFWSGPFGKIEEKQFQKGSEEIARAIIKSGAFSVVGGTETMEFINRLGLADKFDHASTGGGAMLSFLSGDKLPGVEALG
jgi:phosphoglycerate kinase